MIGKSLYHHLIDVTEDYLGPAAQRFIDRQIENHLQKHPKDIDLEDLPQLVQWLKLSISVLTENPRLVEEYATKLADYEEYNVSAVINDHKSQEVRNGQSFYSS